MTFSQMQSRLRVGLKRIVGRVSVAVRCWSLRVNNAIRRRRLEVLDVWLRDPFVIEGVPVQLAWTVTACHQIVIEDVGTIAGDRTGIEFTIKQISEPIKIIFYGHGTREQRQISVFAVHLDLQMPKPAVDIPHFSCLKLKIRELVVAPNLYRSSTVSKLLSVDIWEMSMEHEPFSPDAYTTEEQMYD